VVSTAALLLADGRFPTGGHAHSGGFEVASATFGLDDIEGMEDFLRGRLATTGRTEAGLVAATMHRLRTAPVDWEELDFETEARIPSPTLRKTSRSLGRQWLRAGRQLWGAARFDDLTAVNPQGPHQVLAFSAVADAAGVEVAEAVAIHLHHLIAAVTTAAVRLHGLDPFQMQRSQLALLQTIEDLVTESVALAAGPLAELPATTGPLADMLAEEHAGWDHRLFQS